MSKMAEKAVSNEPFYGRKITHEQMQVILAVACQARTCPMFWGAPGLGKTEGVTQFAEAKHREDSSFVFVELHPVTYDNVDAGGVPVVRVLENGEFTFRAPPDFYSMKRGMILIDELPQSTPSVASSLSKLILPSKYGLSLSDEVTVAATGNRDSDKAATFKLPAQINHRLDHYELVLGIDSWLGWAVNHGIEPLIISFLKLHPELLQDFKPTEKASPNGRSWGRFDRKLKIYGPSNTEMIDIEVAATLGAPTAVQFMGHVRLLTEMPDIDDVMTRPTKASVPAKVDVQAILACALAYRADARNIANIFTYLDRLPTMELGALFVAIAGKRDDKLRFTTPWLKWCQENKIVNA